MKAIFWYALLTLLFAGSLSAQVRDKRTDDRQPACPARAEKDVTVQPLAGGGWPGCSECAADENNIAVCYDSVSIHDANWSPCTGGQVCYYMPGAGIYCRPDCGGSRCYVV
jgi:hypothetical protein